MMSEAVNLLGEAVGMQLLDRRHDPSVENPPSVLQETRVDDLVAQGVLERIFHLGDEARLVQVLASLQPHEGGAERFLRQIRHRPEESEWNIVADGGCHI